MITVGSLFSGIGGIELGLERTGHFSTAWQVENDPYCVSVLEKRWPDVTKYGDINELDSDCLEPVDLICGGFPCQDISVASSYWTERNGIYGEKSGLWEEYARILHGLKPKFAIIENVASLRYKNGGLPVVLRDLASLGYDAEWHSIRASQFGANHRRERVFIIAYDQSLGMEGLWPEGFEIPQPLDKEVLSVRDSDGQWKVEPDLRRVVDGVPDWMDRLKCLGNAVVPAIAESIGVQLIGAVNSLQT